MRGAVRAHPLYTVNATWSCFTISLICLYGADATNSKVSGESRSSEAVKGTEIASQSDISAPRVTQIYHEVLGILKARLSPFQA